MENKSMINQVIHGNSLDVLRKIQDKSIDCIFADPPYWMQTEGVLQRADGTGDFKGCDDDWDKYSSYGEYDNFCHQWLSECKRVLKDDGTIWVIGSFQNIYRIGYIMQNLGFWILNDIVWAKPNAVPNFGGTRFQNSNETIIWCSKSQKSKFTFNYKTMKHLNGGKQDKSIWEIPICQGSERLKDDEGKKLHTTQKPEELLKKVILSSTKPGDVILDPFSGTGTTAAVAKKYGRNFIAIEMGEKYVHGSRKRVAEVVDISDGISNLELEVKPPRVPMDKLIDLGLLYVGCEAFDKDGVVRCVLTSKGYVVDGDGDELSIHKMAAKLLNKVNYNGWDYFYIKRNNELISINDLRYEADRMMNKKNKE